MAVRTREKLIDVAKEVFIQKGVDNTTIADIANASDKGRRTIYTYFKSKIDIYTAVIERVSDNMVAELKLVADSTDEPKVKLKKFLELRLSPSMNTTSPYSALKSLLTWDFGRTVRARRKARQKEVQMLDKIINEGIASGQFDKDKAERLRKVLYTLIRSIDLLLSNEDAPPPASDFQEQLAQFIAEAM